MVRLTQAGGGLMAEGEGIDAPASGKAPSASVPEETASPTPDPAQTVEARIGRFQDAAEAQLRKEIEEQQEKVANNVSVMLDELPPLNASERRLLKARLIPVAIHAKDAVSEISPTIALGWLAAHVLAPWLLLRWSLADHGVILTVITYLGSTLVAMFLDLAFLFASMDILRQERPLWAWHETRAVDIIEQEERDRRKSLVRTAIALALLLIISAVDLMYLRRADQLFIIEMLCLVPLVSLAAIVLASLTGLTSRLAYPQGLRKAARFYPPDTLLLDLLNLAFFTHSMRDEMPSTPLQKSADIRSPYVPLTMTHEMSVELTGETRPRHQSLDARHRLLLAIEAASETAEYLFPGPYRASLRGDPATQNWCRGQSSNIAAAMRRHKEAVLHASATEDFDRMTQSWCAGLVAAAKGDWETLTRIPGAPKTRLLIRNVVRYLLPAMVLIAAAFLLPLVPGVARTPAVVESLRLSLLIPAALVLLAPLTPETAKATERITKTLETLSPGSRS